MPLAADAAADVHVLHLGTPSGRELFAALRAGGHQRPLVALAAALAASPPAHTLPGVTLVVRELPDPLLVFVGAVDAAGRARLAELPALIDDAATRVRPFTWPDVEATCERLAATLRRRLTASELDGCTLVGVPRGGVVVAGLLAYALDLAGAQLEQRSGAPVTVVVDDVLLSGVRLRQVLTRTPGERIVVATLCSHPALRARVEAAEPRVIACVSGVDLHDHGPARLGDGYAAWRDLWSRRVPERYHAALLDLVSFPWSEPQVRLWNPVTETVEPHWWLAPPDACLGHRGSEPSMEVRLADRHPAIERVATTVVPVTRDGATDLIDTAHGRRVRLAGTSQELFDAWLDDDAHSAVAAMATRHGQPTARVAADLRHLLEQLRGRGLLAPSASVEVEGARAQFTPQTTSEHP